jgi:hypothetical protein
VYGLSHCRMQPQVLEMHQSTESSSSAKTPAQSSSSSSTNNNNHTEKDQVSSASSSRSSSPMPQWNQNSLSVKLTPNRPKTRKGKMRGRPPKHLSSWYVVSKIVCWLLYNAKFLRSSILWLATLEIRICKNIFVGLFFSFYRPNSAPFFCSVQISHCSVRPHKTRKLKSLKIWCYMAYGISTYMYIWPAMVFMFQDVCIHRSVPTVVSNGEPN